MKRYYKHNLLKARPRSFIIILLLLISNLILPAQTVSSPEYQLKAVFLFNFTQFVNWPPGSFSSDASPMVIGVLGPDPFGSFLEDAVTGEKVNGHPLIIQHYNTIEDVGTCQILFINLAETKKTGQAITKLNGRNILTVSDSPDFMEQGGMIRFFTRDNKIKLQVNLGAAKNANLDISSKLLRLVDIYPPQKTN